MQALWRSLRLAIVCALALAVAGGAHAAGPSFAPAPGSPFGVGDEPHSIASGDFNRDGKLDLATANISSDSVSLLFGNGAGTFAPARSFAVGDQPHSLVAGDFNRDLKLDLAVANSEDDTISVLLGNGAGGFHEAAGSPLAAGDGDWYLAAGDVNGDRKLDLAVSNVNGAGPFGLGTSVSIFLGDGNGGFAEAPGSPIVNGRANSWIAAGDVDHDGNLDLAVANQGARNATAAQDVTILLGDGTGRFTEASTSPVDSGGQGTTALVLADLDGDRKLDLAATNIVATDGRYSVSVLRGDGHAGFTPAAGSPFMVGIQPFALTLGDLNRDRRHDLAVADTGSDDVTVLLNTTPSARELLAPLRAEVSASSIGFQLKRELSADLLVADAALRLGFAQPIACAALREFVADVERSAGTQNLSSATAASWVAKAEEVENAAGCD